MATGISFGKYTFNDDEVKLVRSNLLCWYHKSKRDLPWRNSLHDDKNNHAYAVWVSEIMLQQTRVSTVINYYNRWMKKWPTVSHLCKASQDEVNQMWSGLGYYSRGKRLFEGAQKVASNFEGKIPTDSTSLMKNIPGVGRYTAAAIASIAFNQPVGVLDGNVIRVLCRLRAIGGNVSSKEVNAHLWTLSNALVDPLHPGDFNQAMMELGALVCSPKNPDCSKCPLRSFCRAYGKAQSFVNEAKFKLLPSDSKEEGSDIAAINKLKEHERRDFAISDDIENCGDIFALPCWNSALGVENYPRKLDKKAPRRENKIVIVIELCDNKKQISQPEVWTKNQSRVLVSKRPKSGLLANLWEFPNEDIEKISKLSKKRKLSDCPSSIAGAIHKESVTKFALEILGVVGLDLYEVLQYNYVGEYTHKFSHIHQTSFIYTFRILSHKKAADAIIPAGLSFQWVNYAEYEKLAKPTLTTNIYKLFRNFHSQVKTKDSCKNDTVCTSKKQASINSFFKKK